MADRKPIRLENRPHKIVFVSNNEIDGKQQVKPVSWTPANPEHWEKAAKRVLSGDIITSEILFDILLLLPAEDLVRCRCVCKSWRALISRSDFVNTHLNKSVRKDIDTATFRLLALCELYPPLPPETLGTKPKVVDYQALEGHNNPYFATIKDVVDEFPRGHVFDSLCILGSCDGLICLRGGNNNEIKVWNPSTREIRVLPSLPNYLRDRTEYFRFRLSPDICGFDYDVASDDYKVVLGVLNSSSSVIAIFALKTGSWRIVEREREGRGKPLPRNCKFTRGALHWIDNFVDERVIKYFNLADERLQVLSSLPGTQEFNNFGLVTGGDHLYYYSIEFTFDMDYFDLIRIWVMKVYGDGESWTEIGQISGEDLPQEKGWLEPIYILENGDVLLHSMESAFLAIYNLKARRTLTGISEIEAATMYVESLVSPLVGGAVSCMDS